MIGDMQGQKGRQITPLERAVAVCGSISALAARLGFKQSTVSMWLNRRRVPPERCRAIEAATGGLVTRYELRPDIYGPSPPRDAAPEAEVESPPPAEPAA